MNRSIWQMTKREYILDYQSKYGTDAPESYHAYAVREAIGRGEDVPEHVLLDYPDLVVSAW